MGDRPIARFLLTQNYNTEKCEHTCLERDLNLQFQSKRDLLQSSCLPCWCVPHI